MLLLVDAGNTRVKWAVAAEDASGGSRDALGRWRASGAADHSGMERLAASWKGLPVTHAVISNVAGAAVRERLQQMLTASVGMPAAMLQWFASRPSAGGVQNRYRNPAQLGCDRFAAAIGAHALFPDQPVVVATCGTATTVDAITADGIFLGGMILPGPGLMAASLAQSTAQLPRVAEVPAILAPFADNTEAAIMSGCMAAQAGAIERAVLAHRAAQPRHADVLCVVSGGAAALIAPHLSVPHRTVDNLVLIGLQVFASTMN